MSRKTVYGIFDDEEVLLNSVKEIKSNNIDIKEVYTPFQAWTRQGLMG